MGDDRLPALLAALPPGAAYFSLEFFPPKTNPGFKNLYGRLQRMASALRPLFVTVTWGAGGSTASKSLELAEVCQKQLGLPTVLHLTCTNMSRKTVDEALESAKEVGIRNILALRGDPPRDEYRDQETTNQGGEDFIWAIDLVRYIRRKYGDYFAVGVAGYPEGHADESHPEAGKQSVQHDLPYLVGKVKAGADFIMTQLTYDIDAYASYEKVLREYVDTDGSRPFATIPIMPGLMPIQSYNILKRITKLSHARIPEAIAQRIEAVKSDDEAVKNVGVEILSELVGQIRDLPQPESVLRGFHFYTLNLEKSVAFILEKTGLINQATQTNPTLVDNSDSDAVVDDDEKPRPNGAQDPGAWQQQQGPRQRRTSSVNAQPHNRVILDRPASPRSNSAHATHIAPSRGTGIPAAYPTPKHTLQISEGQGSLGREATWDDFPNGRWGPSHSPAFGEIDGYGPSLKVGPVTARKLWGHPKSSDDVTNLFKRLVLGDLDAVPWSDDVDPDGTSEGLRAETEVIKSELLALIEKKGYWTLASQPAVDGARSDDETFGWGPPGEGFVFQKAFVEFFCPREHWDTTLRKKLIDLGDKVGWMKTDVDGLFESTDQESQSSSAVNGSAVSSSKRLAGECGINAVTWGVFRGKEIVTPTIIEPDSFRAWGEEAFAMWSEWMGCFGKGSDESRFLQGIKRDVVLVNVVGQNYRGGQAGEGAELWRSLLD